MAELVKRHQHRAYPVGGGVVLLVGFLTTAAGQEAVRMSIASAQAAEARRRAATTIGYYNLKLGPTAWNFGAGLGVEYNSNVNYTETNPEGDFIFRPQINTRMLWPVSEQNSINLALGGGYSAYVKNPSWTGPSSRRIPSCPSISTPAISGSTCTTVSPSRRTPTRIRPWRARGITRSSRTRWAWRRSGT